MQSNINNHIGYQLLTFEITFTCSICNHKTVFPKYFVTLWLNFGFMVSKLIISQLIIIISFKSPIMLSGLKLDH